ncbi:hypothetical protein FVE85_9312 [Porphyridium purpureum]|uniref:Carboxymuconolactone decarboxylase-like domain-containing protein n=1 Tax=Porphyridium purpureum TaxID=35688 RepID=A0A5J4YQ01_PORPP|nr:hypothetical protein FVE85_9312 [Porphyridium purpureum]|eukprot:POR9355..scf222_8
MEGFLDEELTREQAPLPVKTRQVILSALLSHHAQYSALCMLFARLDGREARARCGEAVLQNVAFSGFPKVINALRELQRAGLLEPSIIVARPEQDQNIFGAVYGQTANQVRNDIEATSDVLWEWIDQFVYHTVLSRSLLEPKLRELCIVALLCGSDLVSEPRILLGHMLGALRVGASQEEVRDVIRLSAQLSSLVRQNVDVATVKPIQSVLDRFERLAPAAAAEHKL